METDVISLREYVPLGLPFHHKTADRAWNEKSATQSRFFIKKKKATSNNAGTFQKLLTNFNIQNLTNETIVRTFSSLRFQSG